MDRRDRLNLAICCCDPTAGLAIALLGDATGTDQCDVCLYLAFLRQCAPVGMVGDAPGSDDAAG